MQSQTQYVLSSFKVWTNASSDKIGLTVIFLCSVEVVGVSLRGSTRFTCFIIHFSELLAHAQGPYFRAAKSGKSFWTSEASSFWWRGSKFVKCSIWNFVPFCKFPAHQPVEQLGVGIAGRDVIGFSADSTSRGELFGVVRVDLTLVHELRGHNYNSARFRSRETLLQLLRQEEVTFI